MKIHLFQILEVECSYLRQKVFIQSISPSFLGRTINIFSSCCFWTVVFFTMEKVEDKKTNDFKKAGHVKATNFKGYINSQAYLLWLVKIAHDLLLEL